MVPVVGLYRPMQPVFMANLITGGSPWRRIQVSLNATVKTRERGCRLPSVWLTMTEFPVAVVLGVKLQNAELKTDFARSGRTRRIICCRWFVGGCCPDKMRGVVRTRSQCSLNKVRAVNDLHFSAK